MSSFPEQEVSFVSGRSSRSSSYKPKTRRLQPYVSPFVIEANKRAKQRVREKYAKYSPRRRESSPPVHDSGEWNNNVQTPGLFDPRLRKQEIFRLGPKSSKQSETNTLDSARMHQESTNNSKEYYHNRPAQRLTVRTDADSPRRNPQAYGSRGSQRPDRQDLNPEYTGTNHIMQPKPSEEFPPNRSRVTRSTSPIDDRVMNDIMGVDSRHPESSHFTLRRRRDHRPQHSEDDDSATDDHQPTSSTKPHRAPAAQSAAAFQQFLREHGRARDAMNPQDMREHYGTMIRDRLRQLLQQHREGQPTSTENAEDDGNNGKSSASKGYPYYSRLRRPGSGSGVLGGYFRPGDVADTQLMTRDLMASMAQIMTAVGEIVTNQQQTQRKSRSSSSRKNWYKENPIPLARNLASASAAGHSEPKAASSSTSSPSTSSPTVIAAARVKTPGKAPMTMSDLAAMSAARGIAQLRTKETQKQKPTQPQSQPQSQPQDATRKEFMWDMAQALRPETMLHEAVAKAGQGAIDPADIPLPKNKAAVFDMIFSKLQSIEQCERDLIDFLQQPRELPSSQLPVDPVVDRLKRRQLRQTPAGAKATVSHNLPNKNNNNNNNNNTHKEEEDDTDEEVPAPPAPLFPKSATVENAKSAGQATFDFLKRYPPLGTISSCLRSDFEEYKQKLDRARQLRDAVFLKKHSDLATVSDTVADAICDRIIGSVASEIGGFVEDYSKNYVGKL